MARGKLYEYAVIFHPKSKKDKDGNEQSKKSQLLGEVKRVLAESEQEVSILAARSIPETHLDKLEEIEIVVRPF
jgi:hypothetical protein